MKYLKKFEDLEYTRDDEFNYKKNLDKIFTQISSEIKIIDHDEVKNIRARVKADCINIDGHIKPIYGSIQIDDICFRIYVKDEKIINEITQNHLSIKL